MRRLLSLSAACLLALLAACSSGPPKTALKGIQLIAESEANSGVLATAVDVVFVYDSATASLLPKSGPDWFARKAALMNSLATGIDVVSIEIPPAKVYDVPLPARASKAIGVYSFANYLSAGGQAMGNLTPFKTMTIRLGPDAVVYAGS